MRKEPPDLEMLLKDDTLGKHEAVAAALLWVLVLAAILAQFLLH